MTSRFSRTWRTPFILFVALALVAVSFAFTKASPASANGPTVSPNAVNCPVSGHPTIREGSTGTAVMRAQCLLNLSLNPAFHTPLVVDGDFGPKTDAATRTFQSCEHIQVDGVIGSVTWSHLETVAASPFYTC